MNWSWRIGKVAGIDIFVHWTFLILIGWILLAHLAAGNSLAMATEAVLFLLTIFGCIVLHELGHALMARRFGVRTQDITLLPIGGVARLERMPERPLHEFLIAIAGPLVNVVIALLLLPAVLLLHGFSVLVEETPLVGGQFLAKVLLVNVALTIFNMLPAFPMDGGRVLRAALVPLFGYLRATDIAAKAGQGIAVMFGLLGLMGHPMLVILALFIFVAAQREAYAVQVSSLLRGAPVREAMMTRFRTLDENDRLDTAVYELLASDQEEFPVLHDGQLVGLLRRGDLIESLRRGDDFIHVADIMTRDCGSVDESALLDHLFQEMQRSGCSTVPVLRRGELVGLVSLENIGEWLMIQSAMRERSHLGDPAHPGGTYGTDPTNPLSRRFFGDVSPDVRVRR